MLRALAVVSGIVLISAAAYASLAHADASLTSPYGVITLAVAGGLIAGALCFGAACAAGRHTAALAIAIGMLSGELYSLILTSERVVATREVAQVSLREAAERRQDAARRVREAEGTLASTRLSPRLERALAAKAAADLASASASVSFVTSPGNGVNRGPKSFATCLRRSMLMSLPTTRPPSFRICRAIANPMPDAAPVTSALLSANLPLIVIVP